MKEKYAGSPDNMFVFKLLDDVAVRECADCVDMSVTGSPPSC